MGVRATALIVVMGVAIAPAVAAVAAVAAEPVDLELVLEIADLAGAGG